MPTRLFDRSNLPCSLLQYSVLRKGLTEPPGYSEKTVGALEWALVEARGERQREGEPSE